MKNKNKIQRNMYTYHIKEMTFVNTCKKNYLKFAVCFVFIATALVVMILPHVLSTNKNTYQKRHARYSTDLKYILFWTLKWQRSRYHKAPEFQTGQSAFINQKCPHINCYISYNKSTLPNNEDFDAVVLDIDDIRKIDINFIKWKRSLDQIYIFRSIEAPEKHPLCDHDLDHFFNWTWTYKLTSDIPQPFIDIYSLNNSSVGPKKNMIWTKKMKKTTKFANKLKHKQKAVAWVLTKCKLKNKHQDFIKELRNELNSYNYSLDIYGPCSTKKCPGGRALKCYKMVEKLYYFHIVLEEYLTEDYVTEVMATAMSHFAIPIVLGPADYSNFLPPGSYINAQSFDIQKLGSLINYLIKNKDMYELFFDWKNYYYYKVRPRTQICDLCTKLNEYNGTRQTYDHFRRWWDPEFADVCQRMSLVKIFNTDA